MRYLRSQLQIYLNIPHQNMIKIILITSIFFTYCHNVFSSCTFKRISHLCSDPDAHSPIIKKLKKYIPVTIIKSQNDWRYIKAWMDTLLSYSIRSYNIWSESESIMITLHIKKRPAIIAGPIK